MTTLSISLSKSGTLAFSNGNQGQVRGIPAYVCSVMKQPGKDHRYGAQVHRVGDISISLSPTPC